MGIDKQTDGQTEGRTNRWTDKWTNIYSIFRDKLSLPEGSWDSVTVLQGQGSNLIDKCNHIGPIFLEGDDHLNDWWDPILTIDPVFVLLGVHSTTLDDAQTNTNDITVVHRVACSAGVGSVDEEARCKGLSSRPLEGCQVAVILYQFSLQSLVVVCP
jgi:hypothetical protein